MNNLKRVQKKKSKKHSPYWAFALDFKRMKQREGFTFHNDKQLREMIGPAWDKLSQEEKDRYKDGVKNAEPIVNKNRPKYNCRGEDLEEVKTQMLQEKEGYAGMVEEIDEMLPDDESLDDTVFYFISSEYFYLTGQRIYPAEIALAKFSLRKGLIDDMHVRINPGQLPLGARAGAEDRSKEYHKYPLPPYIDGEKDPLNILEAIIHFLHPMKQLPIFFAEGNTRDEKTALENTCKIVDQILRDAGEDDVAKNLCIYPIDELFFALRKKAIANMNSLNGTELMPFASISFAAEKFRVDEYQHSAAKCDFHHELDCPHCCLSKVRRMGFTFSKWCADKQRYPLIEGKHFPVGFEY